MRKITALGILAVFTLFLPSRSQAVPIDVPYQLLVATTSNISQLVISSTAFPSPVGSINSSVGSYQWCLERGEITSPSAATFSVFWSTAVFGLNTGTTDYIIATSSGVPYAMPLNYRTPYCAPTGAAITLKSSVAGSTITVGGYLFKGWNP